MLELAIAADRETVNAIAAGVHAMHICWRPDLYEPVPELYSRERFTESIGQRQLYVARVNGLAVGYTLLKIITCDWPGGVKRRVMLIDEFGVLEGCRGHGIGTAMMEDIHALARAFGCDDLQLQVYPQNDDALGFYQKCGFCIQNIRMQKKL